MDTGHDCEESKGIEFGEEVDLHHFHPKDTGLVIEEFFRQAVEKGLRRLRIVHGKGKSKKKLTVHKLLNEDERVESYRNDGSNWGATVVFLRSDIFPEDQR